MCLSLCSCRHSTSIESMPFHRSHFHFIVQALHKWSRSSVWGFEENKTFVQVEPRYLQRVDLKQGNSRIDPTFDDYKCHWSWKCPQCNNYILYLKYKYQWILYVTLNQSKCFNVLENKSKKSLMFHFQHDKICCKICISQRWFGLNLYMQGITKGQSGWHFESNMQTTRYANSVVHNAMTFTNLSMYNITWILKIKNETWLNNMIQTSN